jgi:glutamyl-tRNA synthetase
MTQPAPRFAGITRLAPSPTGALHLGNARTFLANWLLARQSDWQIVLRIEDLDGPRIKAGADAQAIEDLRWLGLDWDTGPIYQSQRTDAYQQAIESLVTRKYAYPCTCSRRDARLAAAAPHGEDETSIYPGTCRDRYSSIEDARCQSGGDPAIRFRVPDGIVEFTDAFAGPQRIDAARELGDCVIRKADGTAAYQLAVVVDDHASCVNQVVRGDDLLRSTAWQILLYQSLSIADSIPRYTHLPLVVGGDGRRLAKRHGDSRLSHYQNQGISDQRILALLARWLAIDAPKIRQAADLIGHFDLAHLSRQPIILDKAAEHFLFEGSPA